MSGREKIDAAVDYLDRRGASYSYVAPPHYRLAWLLGLRIPPPHFQGAFGLFAFNFLFFGGLICVMVYFFEKHGSPFEVMLTVVLPLSGVLALLMAGIYRFQAWRLGVPRWSEFPPDEVAPGAGDDEGW